MGALEVMPEPVEFTVKELFIEVREKLERVDEHVQQLELRGTDREKHLAVKVDNLSDRIVSLERRTASDEAVRQALHMTELHSQKLRYIGIGLGLSLLTAVGDFIIILFKHP